MPDKKLAIQQMTKVFGDSGTDRYGGWISEEPNIKWRDQDRVTLVEEMRRGDATIKATLNALKAPILSTEWRIECEDEKIAEFVEENLFEMKRSWKSFMREALTYFDFGFSVFEIVYEIKDGKVYLADLAPRIQSSIQNWKTEDGNDGIQQWIDTDDKSVEGKTSPVSIPMEKLLVLTNEKEGDDITGQSILRSGYKHYYYKDILYRISGIAAERYGVGVPVIYLPEEAGSQERTDAENMLENLRSNEKSYLVVPWPKEKGAVEILTPAGNPQGQSIQDNIDHHNKMILMSVLASFLGLGTDSTGSFALSKDQSSFFLKHVEDKASYLAEEITKQVIEKLVKINFGENAEMPKLKFAPLGDISFDEMSATLKNLVDSGLLEVDEDVANFVRDMFKLPELKEFTPKQKKEVEEPEEIPEEMSQKKNAVILRETEFKLSRELTEAEKRVNFQALNESFNELETSIEDEMAEATKTEIDRYLEGAKKKIDAGDIVGIGALYLILKNKIKKILDKQVTSAYEEGKKSAAQEMGIERPTTPREQVQIKNLDIDNIAETYTRELESTAKTNIKNAISVGAGTAAIIAATRDKMTDTASKMILNTSGTVVGQYINRGRKQVFFDNISKVTMFRRSEVLDGKTCAMCLSLDGRIVKADDAIAHMDLVHSHCFVAGTKVKTDKGNKNIEDIKVGDVVATHKDNWNEVYHTMAREYEGELIKIELANGQIIKCTPNHKFLVNNEWVEAQELDEDVELSESVL